MENLNYVVEVPATITINFSQVGYGLGLVDEMVTRPNGKREMSQVWRPELMDAIASEVQSLAEGYGQIYLHGHGNAWVEPTIVNRLMPRVVRMYNPYIDGYVRLRPFPQGEPDPRGDIDFSLRIDGDRAYLDWCSDKGEGHEHTYRENNMYYVVIPEIPDGKHIFISGKGFHVLACCIALGYMEGAASVSVCADTEDAYVCVFSRDESMRVGDITKK